MNFTIQSLPSHQFEELLALDDAALARRGVRRFIADADRGYPCRVSLRDARAGERVVLLPFNHQSEATPFRASGPIFVREGAEASTPGINDVPEMLRSRLLSIRAYDNEHFLVDADVVDGQDMESLVERFFSVPSVAYLHVHFARPGCFACKVTRQ